MLVKTDTRGLEFVGYAGGNCADGPASADWQAPR